MRLLPSIWYDSSPEAVCSSGSFVLHFAFAVSLVAVLLAAWFVGLGLLLVPVIVAAGVVAFYLFKHPLANLAVVLGMFVVVADYKEGIQVTEILYGLYYFAFLGHWFVMRVFVQGEMIITDSMDRAVALLLTGITLSIPLTFLFGGSPRGLVSEWTSLMLVAMYFPIKEACIRYEHGSKVVVGAILWIGLFAAVRNAYLYQAALSDAEAAWQIAHGRVYFNDNVLMASSLMSLVLMTFTKRWKHLLPIGALFLVLLGGLILTQSRAFWVAFLFGCGIMFLAADGALRRRLLVYSVAGFACFVAVMMLFLGSYVELIFVGLLDRFSSLATALSNDLSLVNRFRESKAVFGRILANPILGYGMSVPYPFYDLVHAATDRDAFVHNAYLGVWYKFGIWGLALVLFAWCGAIRSGIRALRSRASVATRAFTVAAGLALCGLALAALTSNPLYLMDGTLLFGSLTGVAAGGFRRSLLEERIRDA